MNPGQWRGDQFEMEIDASDSEPTWDLGHQNFYPSSRETGLIVYARNQYGT